MDLTHFDVVAASEKPADMVLIGPDGRPTGLTLPVLGFDAEEVVQAGRDFDREYAAKKASLHEQDFLRLRRAKLAAAAVVDWRGITIRDTPLTRANAFEVLSGPSFAWIAERVFVFGANRGNYLKPAPEGS